MKKDSLGLGVLRAFFVGVRGFEPPTSRTRTVRSTGLSHTPDGLHYTIAGFFSKPHYGFNVTSILNTYMYF